VNLTKRPANALKPSIYGAVVKLNAMVGLRFKFKRIEILHYSSLPASTNRLLTSGTSSENFYMHNVVSLRSKLCIIINTAVEYEITRLQLFKFESNR
jgi:hypothetical protein